MEADGSAAEQPLLQQQQPEVEQGAARPEAAEGESGSPSGRRRRRRSSVAKAAAEGDAAAEGSPESDAAVADDEVPEEMMRPSALVTKASKLEPQDHVLITAGPSWNVIKDGNPRPQHGGRYIRGIDGRPAREHRELDPRSLCIHGPFRKPWLRVPNGGCLHNKKRKPTDSPVWYAYICVWVCVVFIAVYAFFFSGDPRLLANGGVDFLGNVCGGDNEVHNPGLLEYPKPPGQQGPGRQWDNLEHLWFPIDPSAPTAADSLSVPLCVSACPLPDRSCDYLGCQPVEVQYAWDERLRDAPWPNCCSERLPGEPGQDRGPLRNYCAPGNEPARVRMNQHCRRQFRVTYPSVPLYRLCVPDIWGHDWLPDHAPAGYRPLNLSASTRQAMAELQKHFPFFTDMWFMFAADTFQLKEIFLVAMGITLICGELYLYAIRINPFWVPWVSYFLAVIGAGASSFLVLAYRSRLMSGRLSVQSDMRKRHERNLTVLGWGIGIVGVLSLLLGFRIRKRMRLGAQMMSEANRALRESPGMVFVAPWVWFLQVAVCALSLAVLSYVGSLHSTTDADDGWLTNYSTFGHSTNLYHMRAQRLVLSPARAPLMTFLLAVFAWTMGLLSVFCYNITAYISVHWFFCTPGDEKKPAKDGVSRAITAATYHLGSYAIAAVILTLFEPVRGLLDSIQGRLRSFIEHINEVHDMLKYLTCLAEWLLRLFDRFLKLVRRDAFAVQCIEGGNFLRSALRAEELYDEYSLRVKTLAKVGNGVALCGRISILSTSALIITFLVTATPVGETADNPALVIFLSICVTWFAATVYGQIINASVDSFLMCFCYDLDVNDGSKKRPYFAHSQLRNLIEAHTIVRNDYRNIGGAEVFFAGGLTAGGVQALATSLANQAQRKIEEEAESGKALLMQSSKAAERAAAVGKQRTREAAGAAARAATEIAQVGAGAGAQMAKATAGVARGLAGEVAQQARALDATVRGPQAGMQARMGRRASLSNFALSHASPTGSNVTSDSVSPLQRHQSPTGVPLSGSSFRRAKPMDVGALPVL